MKKLFKENKIPTLNYRIIGKNFADDDLTGLRLPVVVKPLDSQGQRGVYKLDSIDEIRAVFSDVISFSRENEILVEEYYPSDEITVSGWVHKDKAYILTVTDRICYKSFPHIGICTAHNFPSKFLKEFHGEILHISDSIVRVFEIHEGPIYFQMLIGKEGIKVNEIACRIGGAYEDEFIPRVTDVDILDMLIEASLGKEYDTSELESYKLIENAKVLSVLMIFARPSIIKSMNDMEKIKELPGVLQAGYNFKPGHTISSIENATARAGYMIISGENPKLLDENIRRAYGELRILNEKNENIIINLY
jgi:phosphoribosylamine-glycine ligase